MSAGVNGKNRLEGASEKFQIKCQGGLRVLRAVDMLAPAFWDPPVGLVKEENGWCLITCWDVVWIEATLVTVCLSSWCGNYSPQPGSHSLLNWILRSSPAPMLLCRFELCSGRNSPSSKVKWVYFLCCLEEVEVFELQIHTRNILIAFDNDMLLFEWITKADSAPRDWKDNKSLSSAVCFQSWVIVMFCAGVCWGVNQWHEIKQHVRLCVFWCVCVCGRKEGRYRAGRIIGLPLITHRWLILGLRVWRCPSIHHFLLCSHTHSYTNTIPVWGVAISRLSSGYCSGAQLRVVELGI